MDYEAPPQIKNDIPLEKSNEFKIKNKKLIITKNREYITFQLNVNNKFYSKNFKFQDFNRINKNFTKFNYTIERLYESFLKIFSSKKNYFIHDDGVISFDFPFGNESRTISISLQNKDKNISIFIFISAIIILILGITVFVIMDKTEKNIEIKENNKKNHNKGDLYSKLKTSNEIFDSYKLELEKYFEKSKPKSNNEENKLNNKSKMSKIIFSLKNKLRNVKNKIKNKLKKFKIRP